MAIILDGKKLSEEILNEVKDEAKSLKKTPCLAVILVGDDPASLIYVEKKKKVARDCNFNSKIVKLDKNIKKEALLDEIEKLNKDKNITAILLQLPLPTHLNEKDFISKISPGKDVDCFHPLNVGKIMTGEANSLYPCTPCGILKLLKKYNIKLQGAHVVIVGRSNIVGKPLGIMLLNENATVCYTHSKTKNLKDVTRLADILISATGKAHLITKDMVKKGAVVVDVGIVRDDEGKIAGDVDFSNVKDVASYITPVPGGVGPMTIACLILNTLNLAK